jgi:hypothetical protein
MVSAARDAPAPAPDLAQQSSPPRPEDPRQDRPKLDVDDRRRASSQPRRRQATVLRALGALFVVGALAATAVAHAVVASGQQRLDTLQGQLTQTLVQQQSLQLARAELESPVRVLHIAEQQLGMVVPGSVAYLPAVDPGPSVAEVGAAANRIALSKAAKAPKSRSAGSSKTPPETGAGLPATASQRR